MQLQFKITKQNIIRIDNENVVADSRNYLTAQFSFTTDEWAGKTKTALFIKGNEAIKMLLDDNDCCEVPFEVIKPHMFKVSVFAGNLITADAARVDVASSGYVEGQEPEEPTPDIYQQILDKLDSLQVGEVTPEQVAEAVEKYLDENPVETLTEDEVKQIIQNLTSDMVTMPVLDETLINYAKKEEIPEEYDDTVLKNQIIALESNIRELGYSLALSIDKNYIMSISLLNKEGAVLSTKSFDFPIESTVMNASYANGVMTLILQNGNEVPVNISDLVRGLVNDSRTIAGIDLKDDITADELIKALGIDNKVDKQEGKGLSTNDYDNTEKETVAQNKADIATLKEEVSSLQNAQDITTNHIPTMPNSYPGRVLINEIGGGETRQGSTTGAQLFDANNMYLSHNESKEVTDDGYTIKVVGGTKSAFSSSIYKVDITKIAGKTVWFKMDSFEAAIKEALACVQLNVGMSDGTTKYYLLRDASLKQSVDIPEDVTACTFNIYTNDTSNVLDTDNTVTVKGLILSLDENAEWEPYTGGIASPSTSFPQAIEATVVSEVKTVGAQLCNMPDMKNKTLNGITWSCKNGAVTAVGTSTDISFSNDNSIGIRYDVPIEAGKTYRISGSGNGITVLVVINRGGKTSYLGETSFTLDGTETRCRVYCQVASGKTVNGTVYPMLNYGTEPLPWQPYTESVQKLSNPITLYNHGGVKDTFNPKQKNKRFGVAVFNGSEEWKISSSVTGRYGVEFNGRPKGFCMCSVATYNENLSAVKNQCFLNDVGNFYINTSFETLAEWKEYLQTTPITVVYELAEEETESLPTVDQIALNSLQTYNTVTHLSTDAEIKPTYELKYGTSEVGGYTLEGLLTGRNAELLAQSNAEVAQSNTERLTALEAAVVSNI